MQENTNLEELEKSLITLKVLTEKMNHNLENVNRVVKENINSGAGVWDSATAELYRQRWESLMEEFPEIIETFKNQETNLEMFIRNMKKAEEV